MPSHDIKCMFYVVSQFVHISFVWENPSMNIIIYMCNRMHHTRLTRYWADASGAVPIFTLINSIKQTTCYAHANTPRLNEANDVANKSSYMALYFWARRAKIYCQTFLSGQFIVRCEIASWFILRENVCTFTSRGDRAIMKWAQTAPWHCILKRGTVI